MKCNAGLAINVRFAKKEVSISYNDEGGAQSRDRNEGISKIFFATTSKTSPTNRLPKLQSVLWSLSTSSQCQTESADPLENRLRLPQCPTERYWMR